MATITALFDTRREAELAVEHLVQEYEIDRDDIVVGPEGDENSVGLEANGSDEPAEEDEDESEDGAALNGRIEVAVTLGEDEDSEIIYNVLLDYGGTNVVEAE